MGDTEVDLLPCERLLWTGRPARARVLPGDLLLPGLLLLSLLVTAIAWGGRPPVAIGEEVVFSGASAAFLIATAIWALRVRPAAMRRTVYRVTDRRVLLTTGPGHSWAAYLDQLAEPAVDQHADVLLRQKETISFFSLNNRQPLPRAFIPGGRQPFPVLRGLLDIPPAGALPHGSPPPGFVPAPGERVLWVGQPRTVPWWFGGADLATSAYFAVYFVAFGFMVSWASSAKAPPALLGAFTVFAALIFGFPAVGRLLVRRARIRRSTYILTDRRLIADWDVVGCPAVARRPDRSTAADQPARSAGGSPAHRRRPAGRTRSRLGGAAGGDVTRPTDPAWWATRLRAAWGRRGRAGWGRAG
jgi:hypothetical protein